MTLIKKYSIDISKEDFSKIDPQSLEDTIDNLSSDLCDNYRRFSFRLFLKWHETWCKTDHRVNALKYPLPKMYLV